MIYNISEAKKENFNMPDGDDKPGKPGSGSGTEGTDGTGEV